MTQEAYIVAGLRTAVGKAPRGAFRFVRPDDLAVDLLAQLMAKVPELDPARVEDLIVGNAVPEAEQGLPDRSHDSCAGISENYRRHDGESLLRQWSGDHCHRYCQDPGRNGRLHRGRRSGVYESGTHGWVENGPQL